MSHFIWMRLQAPVVIVVAFVLGACAQNPPPPIIVEKIVEKPVIVEKIVEKKVYVDRPVATTASVPAPAVVPPPPRRSWLPVRTAKPKRTGSSCHTVRGYTRKNGTYVSGHTRCRN